MGFCVAISVLVCRAIGAAFPSIVLGCVLLLVVIGEAARRAVTTGNAASAGGNH